MNQKTIILFVILFSLIIVGMFIFATMRKAELSTSVVSLLGLT